VNTALYKQKQDGDQDTERKNREDGSHCCESDAVGRSLYSRDVVSPVTLTQSLQHPTEQHFPQAATRTDSFV
jgi:hypothetical protein